MGNVDDEEEDDFKVRKKRRRWILRDVKNNNTQQDHDRGADEKQEKPPACETEPKQHEVGCEDETLPQLVKVPSPVPLSWCRSVAPYRKRQQERTMTPDDEDCCVIHEKSIADMNFDTLKKREVYLGLHINPDWTVDHGTEKGDRLQRLRKIPLNKLCPKGFIFIWIDKRDVQGVCELMYKQKYVYVENLTWVYMRPDNKMVHNESKYMRNSHLTLYIFRKHNEGKDIELRHQRNPDVVLDCIQATGDGYRKVPKETYKAIETLLPGAHNRLLELWSATDNVRKGWTQVLETH